MYQRKRIWQPIVSFQPAKLHNRGMTNIIKLACGHTVKRRACTPIAVSSKGMQCRDCERAVPTIKTRNPQKGA